MEKILPSIKFLPSSELVEKYSHAKSCNIIILDDFMDSVVSNAAVEKLFTLGAYHKRLVIIYLNQIFCQESKTRTVSLNTHFLVLMNNPRGLSSLQCLSKQVFCR